MVFTENRSGVYQNDQWCLFIMLSLISDSFAKQYLNLFVKRYFKPFLSNGTEG